MSTVASPSSPDHVTTGPIMGSTKVWSSPEGHAHIRVPFREIALEPGANEPPVRVYDTSGPYTDPAARIDVRHGLPPIRAPWIAARDLPALPPPAVPPPANGFAKGAPRV
ncbi:MAG: phosphomethylpyrimidine synthase ThiC, partial [Komagataeibacter rhaeticus]